MPRYSPPLLDSINTTGAGISSVNQNSNTSNTSTKLESSLVRLEKQITADKIRITRNHEDLIKLQKLTDNAENSTLTNFSNGLLGTFYLYSNSLSGLTVLTISLPVLFIQNRFEMSGICR